MKKKVILLWSLFAAMTFSACTENNDAPINEEAKSNLVVKFNFSETDTRATASTAIPTTSWSNIDQVQLFLYDAAGVVKYSKIVKPNKSGDAGNSVTGGYQYTYADVPVGTYTLVAVANANRTTGTPTVGGFVNTYIDDAPTAPVAVWSDGNVRAKNITTDLFMKHQAGTFPDFLTSAVPGFSTSNKAYKEPAEIFMGTAVKGTGATSTKVVTITEGVSTDAGTISLKREVSMMRVRLNVSESAAGVDNTTAGTNGIDWTKDASIMIYRLPAKVNIHDARTIQASVETDILSISGTNVFKTAEPASGYGTGGVILTDNFSMWRDIIVFPNAEDAAKPGKAAIGSQYFIVVSGQGKVGHQLADGEVMTAAAPIYWSGIILDTFESNVIREVNLTLKTGGVADPPAEPIEYGGLDVVVGTPIAWDSIVSTGIDM
ncbi:FimB/Mfa2 family fimbrial subunit [Bacteroides sp. UBA939]|uniref:FimB/Mfa2 family fimbrial subunit n=1 Tax=Bacteroides sp. UBA939 TaxID=1946092 RepID=UPI0025BE35BB|nr:FimB/Mfa2 family fimbrial subunit [Bacteroides sp. UBA939]